MALPDKYKDFFNKVAPSQWITPLSQLKGRYEEKAEEDRRGNAFPMTNLHGVDYIVELRVREWMMRMQKEEAELRRIKKEADRKKNGIPAPPRPRSPNPPKP